MQHPGLYGISAFCVFTVPGECRGLNVTLKIFKKRRVTLGYLDSSIPVFLSGRLARSRSAPPTPWTFAQDR